MDSISNFIVKYKDMLEILIKCFTLLGLFLGGAWTCWQGFNTYRNYKKEKTDEKISKWILMLSEDNKIKRLSSVNGLINHCDTIFKELFLLCISEREFFIKRMLYDALIENCQSYIQKSMDLNMKCAPRQGQNSAI